MTRTSTGGAPAAGAVVSLGYDPDGKRIRRKVRGQTRTEVRDKLRGLHSDIEAGIRKPPSLDVPGAVPTPGDAVTLEVTLRDRPACR